ncbi:hypothetical protein RG959_09620 [Domibacillus sp. 8LH]|uniref:hypothetical protein n=1 Tax=Domibacillus sp. 8LH TaxID=3073900 RepID=UPI00316FF38F
MNSISLGYFRNSQKKERVSELHIVSENNPADQDTIEIPTSNAFTMKQIINFLQNINTSEADYEIIRRDLETVKQEKSVIEAKYEALEKRAATTQQDYEDLEGLWIGREGWSYLEMKRPKN